MKKILSFVLAVLGFHAFSQNYVLDDAFGDGGNNAYHNTTFAARDALLANSNYYVMSETQIVKLDLAGAIVSEFGTNGYRSLNPVNATCSISGFLFNDGYLYAYGSVKSTGQSNIDIFIAKIDESGNLASDFGTGGIVRLDLGTNEEVKGFLVEASGKLFAVGTKVSSSDSYTSRAFMLKLNADGTTDTSFSAAGYKEITFNIYTKGAAIFNYNGDYVVVGSAKIDEPGNNRDRVFIARVDTDGNILADFGVNGFQVKQLDGDHQLGDYAKSVRMRGDKIYAYIQGAENLTGAYYTLWGHDLSTNQQVFEIGAYINTYFNVYDDGILMTGWCGSSCCSGGCNEVVRLNKYNLAGTIQTSFQGTGSFTYEYPYASQHPELCWSYSYAFHKGEDGKIMVAGFISSMLSMTPNNGFATARFTEGALASPQYGLDSFAVSPNPFNSIVNIKSESAISSIEVYDVTGQKIRVAFSKNDREINVSFPFELANGMYFLKVMGFAGESSVKVIVKE